MKFSSLRPGLFALGLALLAAPSAPAAELPQFRSILIDGQSRLFSLADNTGSGRWLALGESFEDWKLESFDPATQTLTLSRAGATRQLTLDSALTREADTKGTVADADALLQRMRFDELLESSLRVQQEAMAKSMGQMLGQNATEAERAQFVAFQQRLMELMFREMDLPGLRQDLAKIYADTFTAAEIKAQADFYSTPAGQSLIDKQPVIQQRMTEIILPRTMKAMPKIQALAAEFAAEQAAARAKATPQP
jgi:hypothetical protein